jgi:hypothetical protein
MNGNDIISLGLGIEAPWKISGQSLNQELSPHELRITLSTDRGATFPCPVCKKLCKAHDFRENTWRHLNFFQHHCYITAAVPRIRCEEHGVKKIEVPWARRGSKFTLLFEQVALSLVKEMPVNSAARIIGIADKKLWRIVFYYISVSMNKLDLSTLTAIGFDETASKRRHNYVTVFIDLDKEKQPVIFATVGKGKEVLRQFKQFLHRHGGHADRIVELGEVHSRPPTPSKLDESFGIFKGSARYWAVIRFTGTAAALVKNQLWHKDQRIDYEGDDLIMSLPVADDRELIMKIMQYGAQARVLAPVELAAKIKDEARRMLQTYDAAERK